MSASLRSLTLSLLCDHFAIVHLANDAAVPVWASAGQLLSITRTEDELSIVWPVGNIQPAERPPALWRTFKVHGPLKFDEIGILASLATPLATTRIRIFVISTFGTDYLLVQSTQLRDAVSVLKAAGHNLANSDFIYDDTKENES
jgi:hypothetical protein